MSSPAESSDGSRNSWDGDIIAGILRTRNWSAWLTASEQELVLDGPMKMKYVLSPSEVQEVRVAVAKFLFWSWKLKNGISIVHSKDGVPSKLAFRARNVDATAILDQLKALGYNVS